MRLEAQAAGLGILCIMLGLAADAPAEDGGGVEGAVAPSQAIGVDLEDFVAGFTDHEVDARGRSPSDDAAEAPSAGARAARAPREAPPPDPSVLTPVRELALRAAPESGQPKSANPGAQRRFREQNLHTLGRVREHLDTIRRAREPPPPVAESLEQQRAANERAWKQRRLEPQVRRLKMPSLNLDGARRYIEGLASTWGATEGAPGAASILAAEAAEAAGRRFDRRGSARSTRIAFAPGAVGVPRRASTPVLQAFRPRTQLPIRFRGRTVGGKEPPPPGIRAPGGVKIAIDANTLRAALDWTRADEELAELLQLEDMLADSGSAEGLERLETYMEGKKAGFLMKVRSVSDRGEAHFVPLRALIQEAELHRGAWSDRPASLRTVGGLTRIHGFLRDEVTNGLILIGVREQGAPAIVLDDLTVGLRCVWQQGRVPTCSLNPRDNDPEHRQWSLVDGVPGDSPFALAMLEADFLMKRLMFGIVPTRAKGLRMIDHLGESGLLPPGSRFWFYPEQPAPRSIELGPEGRSALFHSRAQVLSEDLAGLARGDRPRGRSHPMRRAQAAAFTSQLAVLAREQPDLARLQGLFDIVTLSVLLRELSPADQELSALAGLPYDAVEVPESYPQQVAATKSGKHSLLLYGGCDVGVRLSVGSLFESEHADLRRLALASAGGTTARLLLPAVGGRSGPAERFYQAGTRALYDGSLGDAERAFGQAIRADPTWIEAYVSRAKVRLVMRRYADAAWDAARAVQLAPDMPTLRRFFEQIVSSSKMNDLLEEAGITPALVLTNLVKVGERALALSTNGQDKEMLKHAREAYENALTVDSKHSPALAGLAFVAIVQGDEAAAVSALRDAIASDPHQLVVWTRMAYVAAQLKDDETALWLCDLGLKRRPGTRSDASMRAVLYMTRADVLLRLRRAGAIDASTRAVEEQGGKVETRVGRADVIWRLLQQSSDIAPNRKRRLVETAAADLTAYFRVDAARPLNFSRRVLKTRSHARALEEGFKVKARELGIPWGRGSGDER